MAFVHGYGRDLGWVRAHRRPPNRAEGGQLALIAAVPPAEVVALGPARADEHPATADDVGPPAHN